jgi:hypothetical protein
MEMVLQQHGAPTAKGMDLKVGLDNVDLFWERDISPLESSEVMLSTSLMSWFQMWYSQRVHFNVCWPYMAFLLKKWAKAEGETEDRIASFIRMKLNRLNPSAVL